MFPLQRLGAEVWAIHTVQFSNHTGYGHWTGDVFGAASIRALVDGIEARGVLPRCDAVLSGYLGSPAIGEAVLDAVARVRAANPRALYCCDPVIGDDDTGIYVRPGIPELLARQILPTADIITPNRFEVEQLTGVSCSDLEETKAAVMRLTAMLHPDGPRIVLLTSLRTAETPTDSLDILVAEAGRFHLLRTPLLPLQINGTGDAIAALFLFHRLSCDNTAEALSRAGSSLHGILQRTAERDARELCLIEAQEELVHPSRIFTPISV